ncbi:hypothetical protein ZWY2020_033360 [Hordeum vulgare]|nr:hypothetical protein ZWY2020_033360 [Hordeum vulgare]
MRKLRANLNRAVAALSWVADAARWAEDTRPAAAPHLPAPRRAVEIAAASFEDAPVKGEGAADGCRVESMADLLAQGTASSLHLIILGPATLTEEMSYKLEKKSSSEEAAQLKPTSSWEEEQQQKDDKLSHLEHVS